MHERLVKKIVRFFKKIQNGGSVNGGGLGKKIWRKVECTKDEKGRFWHLVRERLAIFPFSKFPLYFAKVFCIIYCVVNQPHLCRLLCVKGVACV